MIKVLREGYVGRIECPDCEALLQYMAKDVREHVWYDDGDEYGNIGIETIRNFIVCPCCEKTIWLGEKEYLKGKKDATNAKYK